MRITTQRRPKTMVLKGLYVFSYFFSPYEILKSRLVNVLMKGKGRQKAAAADKKNLEVGCIIIKSLSLRAWYKYYDWLMSEWAQLSRTGVLFPVLAHPRKDSFCWYSYYMCTLLWWMDRWISLCFSHTNYCPDEGPSRTFSLDVEKHSIFLEIGNGDFLSFLLTLLSDVRIRSVLIHSVFITLKDKNAHTQKKSSAHETTVFL